jgi:hypothetical protein
MKLSRFAVITVAVVALLFAGVVVVGVASTNQPAPAQANAPLSVISGNEVKHDLSPNLRDIAPLPIVSTNNREANENAPVFDLSLLSHYDDPVVQSSFTGQMAMPGLLASFNGIGFPGVNCNCAPPDTNGDVSLTQYVQTVNTGFQVFSKTGTSLYGPAAINTIWSGFGGPCQSRNDGDPVVLYDQAADRWLISQFTAASPYNECVAISQTSDATGAWYRYAFQLSTSDFPDYPHLGVWSDGYYMSVNWFVNGTSYGGPRPYVFNRSRMLLGQSATFQTTSGPLGSGVAPVMPADIDGTTAPPTGAANPFIGTPATSGALPIYKFHVDWTTPANSTWTGPTNLAGASYTRLCPTSRSCVPQYGTSTKLDGIGDRMMFRAAYRNFGTYESLITNLSVSVGSNKRNSVAGIRWYEIRNISSTPTIYQQGTYAPDSTYRWMGSAAQDRAGNIAIGFSASSSSINPQIRYAGRLATDPLGQLSQGEATLFSGTGSQTGNLNRWGDYSDLTVDPSDNCTFWYTTEYIQTNGSFNWKTRIGSFKFASCTSGPAVPGSDK